MRECGKRLADWLLRDAETGRLVLAQPPNAAIYVWATTTLLRVADASGERGDQLFWLGRGALTVWGLDELARGASPFRRLLGAAVLGWQAVSIGLDLFAG